MTVFKKHSCQLLLVESDLGGAAEGAAAGPEAIRQWLAPDLRVWQRLKPNEAGKDDQWPNARKLEAIQPLLTDLHQSVRQYYSDHPQHKLLLLSGDHSSACAAIAGLKAAFPASRVGVIWIDAHADIHTPASTPSGNLHGMPLGAILAAEMAADTTLPLWKKTTELCAEAISSRDLVYIGIRDLEDAEWRLLDRHQICAWTATQLQMEGAATIAQKALQHLAEVDLIYLSFDIDALDASIAAATGTPVIAGLSEAQAQILLKRFMADPRVKLLEMTEFAPVLDQRQQTAGVLKRLLAAAVPELIDTPEPAVI